MTIKKTCNFYIQNLFFVKYYTLSEDGSWGHNVMIGEFESGGNHVSLSHSRVALIPQGGDHGWKQIKRLWLLCSNDWYPRTTLLLSIFFLKIFI